MARTKGALASGWLRLLVVVLLLTGCASYQGRMAYERAEQLAAEENYDQAVEKYYEAAQLEPGSKTYKLKLISARTRAAVSHIKQARELTQAGKIEQAIEQYRLARGFDPSLEIAASEQKQLEKELEAEQLVEKSLALYQSNQVSEAHKLAQRAHQLAPDNARVQALMSRFDQRKHVVAMDGVELDVASSEPLTLRFKSAKIKEVFNVLTKLTGINFIMDEGVRDQAISVFLEDASFAQAMELILQMNGLEKKVLNSKTIIIYQQSRDKEKQYGDQIIQTFYLSHIDAKKAVNLLRTMLQLRKVYVHEERNALVIRDKPEVIRLAEMALDAADRENSEVIFALELVSVSDTDALDFGPGLSTYSVSAGFSEDGTNIVSGSLGNTTDRLVQSLNNLQTFYTLPSATFSLAKTLSGTQVLASPKIRVRNNEKGKVHVGTREPIVTTTTTDGGTVSENITYVDVGIKVDIEPNIKLDNTVETKLTLEVSQAEQLSATSKGTIPLRIRTTNAQTVLTLQDGVQTIIGGLFSQDENSSKTTVPLFGEIPLLGNLFSKIDNKDTRQEILFSITPYIVKQVAVPTADIATIWSGGEDNLKAGPNFGAFVRPLQSEVETITPAAAPSLNSESLPIPAATHDLPETSSQGQDEGEQPTAGIVSPAGGPGGDAVSYGSDDSSGPVPEGEGPNNVTSARLPDSVMTMALAAAVMPQAGAAKRAEPSLSLAGPRTIEVGQEFELTVEIDGVTSLSSAPLFVNYDPVRLNLMGIKEGSFLEMDGRPADFSSHTKKEGGQTIIDYKQADGGIGASGSGRLFTLQFRAQSAGSALIDLNRVNFRDPQGRRLSVEPAAARIEVH